MVHENLAEIKLRQHLRCRGFWRPPRQRFKGLVEYGRLSTAEGGHVPNRQLFTFAGRGLRMIICSVNPIAPAAAKLESRSKPVVPLLHNPSRLTSTSKSPGNSRFHAPAARTIRLGNCGRVGPVHHVRECRSLLLVDLTFALIGFSRPRASSGETVGSLASSTSVDPVK